MVTVCSSAALERDRFPGVTVWPRWRWCKMMQPQVWVTSVTSAWCVTALRHTARCWNMSAACGCTCASVCVASSPSIAPAAWSRRDMLHSGWCESPPQVVWWIHVLKQGGQPGTLQRKGDQGSEPNLESAFPIGRAELAANSCLLCRGSAWNTDIHVSYCTAGLITSQYERKCLSASLFSVAGTFCPQENKWACQASDVLCLWVYLLFLINKPTVVHCSFLRAFHTLHSHGAVP